MSAIESAGSSGPSRVELRLPRPVDEPAFVALRRASRAHLEPWEPAPPGGHDAGRRGEFERYLAARGSPRRKRWLVWRREDGELLGACALTSIARGVLQSAALDYWIGAPFARQGYMGEALGLLVGEAFGPLELHRVEALVLPENEPSRRLLARAGFRCEGLARRLILIRGAWRDHERWALTREEWGGGSRPALAPGAATPGR